MNLHPIFVHFPIAFLTIYSIFELVRVKIFTNQPFWFYLKAVMVFVGTAFIVPSIIAGKLIEGYFKEKSGLVELHSYFAFVTAFIFTIISLIYLLNWIGKYINIGDLPKKFLNPVVQMPLALVGLILITITGGLGGIIAFGTGNDPFADFIYHLFFR